MGNEQKDIGPKELTHTGAELLDIASAHTWIAWHSSLASIDFILSICCNVFIGWGMGSARQRIDVAV